MATHRQCTIKITNGCSNYVFYNPRVYLNSGRCAKPLPLTLDPSTSDSALFTNTPQTTTDAAGVFTYDLLDNHTYQSTDKIAVMFSVPYDIEHYSNMYAVGIFDMTKDCDYNLYHEMYYEEQTWFVRGEAKGPRLTYESSGVTITATMTDTYEPVMKVQVFTPQVAHRVEHVPYTAQCSPQ